MGRRNPKAGPPASDLEALVSSSVPASETPADEYDDELSAVQSVLEQAAGFSAAKVTVHRANKNEPQRWLFTCDPESFSMEVLRDKYGGGDFRLYISRDGRPWRSPRVSIEPPPKAEKSEVTPSSPDQGVLAIMREGFERQAKALEQLALSMRQQSAPQAFDPSAALTALVTALSTLHGIAKPPASLPVPAGPSPEKAVELLMRGLELGKELGSGGGGDSSVLDLVRDLIRSPMVAQAVKAAVDQSPTSQPPAKAVIPAPRNAHVITPPKVPQQPSQPPPSSVSEDALAHYVKDLVERAERDSDPALYADYILDNVPPEVVAQWVERPDLISQCERIDPRVSEYLPWFEELLAEVRVGLAELTSTDVSGNGVEISTDVESSTLVSPTSSGNIRHPS